MSDGHKRQCSTATPGRKFVVRKFGTMRRGRRSMRRRRTSRWVGGPHASTEVRASTNRRDQDGGARSPATNPSRRDRDWRHQLHKHLFNSPSAPATDQPSSPASCLPIRYVTAGPPSWRPIYVGSHSPPNTWGVGCVRLKFLMSRTVSGGGRLSIQRRVRCYFGFTTRRCCETFAVVSAGKSHKPKANGAPGWRCNRLDARMKSAWAGRVEAAPVSRTAIKQLPRRQRVADASPHAARIDLRACHRRKPRCGDTGAWR